MSRAGPTDDELAAIAAALSTLAPAGGREPFPDSPSGWKLSMREPDLEPEDLLAVTRIVR